MQNVSSPFARLLCIKCIEVFKDVYVHPQGLVDEIIDVDSSVDSGEDNTAQLDTTDNNNAYEYSGMCNISANINDLVLFYFKTYQRVICKK